MKIIFLFTILTSLFQAAYSQEHKQLVIHFKTGSSAIFPIERQPKITFDNGIVAIDTELYQISNISKYTFNDSDHSNIEAVDKDGNIVKIEKGAIYFKADKSGIPIKLFEVNGIEHPVNIKDADNGIIKIDLSGLDKKVYMLKIGSETIKIKKK